MTTDPPIDRPGWKTLTVVAAFYLGCLALATWPSFAEFGSSLPLTVDPMVHLWTMRWYKSCLIEGRLPFFCPDIQYPVGASLGSLPPMHFQTLLYLGLAAVYSNDIFCYNMIRVTSFLLTGLGTYWLIWHVVRSRLAACLGGMVAMLGTPMLFFSHGEVEQITVGWFPVFLVAWLRWVDRPSFRGLVAAVGLYTLVAMSSPYFAVFAVFPAVLYVVWQAIGTGWSGIGAWLRARAGWFLAFAGVTGPIVVVLFSNQIWSLAHGQSMARPEMEFARYRAPLWGYLVPPPTNLLSRWLPFSTDLGTEECLVPSYPGVVSLALIAFAGFARVQFPRRGFWWTILGLFVLLSMGSHAKIGGLDISLPAGWLKRHFIGFRMIRVPARFNLFAGIILSVVAAAGFRHLLAKMPHRSSRIAVFGALSVLALADLGTVPYPMFPVPPMPVCYETILKADPAATFVDVPQFNSGPFQLASACTYWQSFHRGKTSAGYTAFFNTRLDNLLVDNSPFNAFRLAEPNYLADPAHERFELAPGLDFRSYSWLYLKVHNLRYVVVHHKLGAFPEFLVRLDRLEGLLADARIAEDAETAVFDRDRLPTPTSPVLLYAEGWNDRAKLGNGPACMLGRTARVHVYNPTPEQPLSIRLEVMAHRKPRVVTLQSNGGELARWQVSTSESVVLTSPPFLLEGGLQELTIESDGEEPAPKAFIAAGSVARSFSLWASRIELVPTVKSSTLTDR